MSSLPVDVIKIDRSFVTPLGNNKKASLFFGAIVSLIKTIDLRVLAEGVETEAQLQELKRAGCDAVQGYMFSKPINAADATLLLNP